MGKKNPHSKRKPHHKRRNQISLPPLPPPPPFKRGTLIAVPGKHTAEAPQEQNVAEALKLLVEEAAAEEEKPLSKRALEHVENHSKRKPNHKRRNQIALPPPPPPVKRGTLIAVPGKHGRVPPRVTAGSPQEQNIAEALKLLVEEAAAEEEKPLSKQALEHVEDLKIMAKAATLSMDNLLSSLEPVTDSEDLPGHRFAPISHNFIYMKTMPLAQDIHSVTWGVPEPRAETKLAPTSLKQKFFVATRSPAPQLEAFAVDLYIDHINPALRQSTLDLARGLPEAHNSEKIKNRYRTACDIRDGIRCMPSKNLVLTSAGTRYVSIWDFQNTFWGQIQMRLDTGGNACRGVFSVGRDDTVVAGGAGGYLYMWKLGSVAPKEILLPKEKCRVADLGEITATSMVHDAHSRAVASTDMGHIVFLDFRAPGGKGASPRENAHQRSITSMQCHPSDPHRIITGSEDNTVRIWDVRGKHSSINHFRHRDKVTAVEWCPHLTNVYLSASMDGTVEIRADDPHSQARMQAVTRKDDRIQAHVQHGGPVTGATWNPDPELEGTILSCSITKGSSLGSLQVWRGQGYLQEVRRQFC
ncbi:WD40-repeat-containing domain protein [Powellomyces hirtus]|nr:WD40-repeat-containing domain protein [Powellomyces hirtus]